MLGLGLGLSKGTNLLSNLKLFTRNADFAFWGDKASGQSFPTLLERTLPNGVKNGIHTKNVSDDYVYSSVNILNTLNIYTNVSLVEFPKAINWNAGGLNAIVINGFIESSDTFEDTALNIGKYYTTADSIYFYVAKNKYTDVNDARNNFFNDYIGALTFTFRYQLATPVDTLNSPQVNPIQDLVGNADGTLQGFAFTTASGHVDVVAPNGKTVTGIQGDGVNDVILLPSNAPNPTSGNFAFGLIVKTGANKVKYLLTRNVTNDADTQYAFKFDASGNLFVILEGVAIQIGTALSIGFHSIWLERDSGTLKAFIDGVETYSGAHATTLTSRANTVMMASTTGTGTYTGFSNDILLASKYCDSDIATNRADWFKFDTKVYGL